MNRVINPIESGKLSQEFTKIYQKSPHPAHTHDDSWQKFQDGYLIGRYATLYQEDSRLLSLREQCLVEEIEKLRAERKIGVEEYDRLLDLATGAFVVPAQ
jgi:hypothetical protein